jgi:hypothetical protein
VETERPESPLSLHPLETSKELNLGNGETVSEMERSVHVLCAGGFLVRYRSLLLEKDGKKGEKKEKNGDEQGKA